jgi:hypothetical protein
MFWHAQLGYPTESIRDDILAAFTAGVAEHDEHLTPSTWDEAPDVPAGIGPTREVDGLPGFTFAFNVEGGWENTDEWIALSDTAQEPSEGGSQQMHTLPD